MEPIGEPQPCPVSRPKAQEDSQPPRFEAVFAAFVQAAREEGHTVESLSPQSGRFVFTAGMSLTCWGMTFSVAIIEDADGSYSAAVRHTYPWPMNWGQGRRIFRKVKERAGKILAGQDASDPAR